MRSFLIAMVSSILLSSCCSVVRERGQARGDKDWLNYDAIMATLANQAIGARDDWQAGFARDRHLIALRKEADLLLELSEPANLKVLDSKVKGYFPTNEFPVADLQKFVRSYQRHRPIGFAIVMIPSLFSIEKGRPMELDLMREIDLVLCKAGVKKRMFQLEKGHVLELHSWRD